MTRYVALSLGTGRTCWRSFRGRTVLNAMLPELLAPAREGCGGWAPGPADGNAQGRASCHFLSNFCARCDPGTIPGVASTLTRPRSFPLVCALTRISHTTN